MVRDLGLRVLGFWSFGLRLKMSRFAHMRNAGTSGAPKLTACLLVLSRDSGNMLSSYYIGLLFAKNQ